MRPHRAVCRALALTLGLVAAGTGLATPAAAVSRTVSTVSIFGEAGDPLTGGEARVWRSGHDTVTMTTADDGVRILAKAPDGTAFDLLVQARTGERFIHGEFPDTAATPTADHAALDLTSAGRSCEGGQTGHFKLLDVSPDLQRVWILFEQRCAGATGSSFGEIRINQEADPALLITTARLEFPDQVYGTGGTTVPVTVVNTSSEPITIRAAEIIGRPTRTTANPVIDESLGLAQTLSFAVSGTTCRTLAPGESCVVMVTYRPVLLGPVEASLKVTDAAAGKHEMYLAAFSDTPA